MTQLAKLASRTILGFVLISLICVMSFPISDIANISSLPDGDKNGPYVDKLLFKIITQDDQQIEALLNDEIDLIGDFIDPTFNETLVEANDIELESTLRNGYGYYVINCAKYPFNLTAFRRALAFAFDKEAISEERWDGLAEPLDSPVPKCNPFSIEGELPYSYYSADIEMGNYLLDAAGFILNETTGYRTAPNGEAFDVIVEVAQSGSASYYIRPPVRALESLQINVTGTSTSFYDYLNRLYFHGDYDIVFLGSSFRNFDVDWLAYEYWSEYADEPYQNFPNFNNSTYDSWRDQLLHSTDYDEVYEAAIEMQKVLIYESPIIVAYENILRTAYRTDKFEGFVNDVHDGVPSWWTLYKTRLITTNGNPFGGTLRISNSLDIDTWNFMVSPNYYGLTECVLWDTLMKEDPDGSWIPWLADSYRIETHSDNPSVIEGHTRFTFEILQNATWSDDAPLTAEDIAFTLNYYREATFNPYERDLTDMIAAYAKDSSTLVVEFGTESYWHLGEIADKPILPKHVFSEFNVSEWNLWNPNPSEAPMVTSGAFNVTDYQPGEFTELTFNPSYFFGFDRDSWVDPSMNENPIPIDLTFFYLNPLSVGVTFGSVVLIIWVIVLWVKETR